MLEKLAYSFVLLKKKLYDPQRSVSQMTSLKTVT